MNFAAFKKPFAEQLEFFRGKAGNLVPTARWDDIWQSAHDTAFVVAGAAKADLLADFYNAVERTIAEGKSLGAFRSDFDAIVAKHGWSHTGGRDWRSRVIYGTNIATSYAAGREAQIAAGGKRRCADTRLLDGLLEKLPGKPALIGAQMVDAWSPHVFDILALRFNEVADKMIETRRYQGRNHFVGAMRANWVERALAAGGRIASAELTVRDMDIGHAMRPGKIRAGKAVDPKWYRDLPLHLRKPDALLLLAAPKQQIQLIYDSGGDMAKIVVLLDYAGTGLNVVRTASRLIETDSLRSLIERGEAVLLEGRL